MKNINYDLTREFILRHKHELRSLVINTGSLLPEAGELISMTQLPEEHRAAIVAFCGTLEFLVVEVALVVGTSRPRRLNVGGLDMTITQLSTLMEEATAPRDQARILLQPISGSNFTPSNLNCQSILQPFAEKARVEEVPATKSGQMRAESGGQGAQSSQTIRSILTGPTFAESGLQACLGAQPVSLGNREDWAYGSPVSTQVAHTGQVRVG